MIRGSHHSPETIEKLRIINGMPRSEDRCKKQSETMKRNHPPGPTHYNFGMHRSKAAREKMSKSAIGKHAREKSGKWNGGITHHMRGYVLKEARGHPFADKGNYVLEHRLIIESIIGRYLDPGEIVHHINKITNDNRPGNLMAFINQGAHRRFESGRKYRLEEIIFDGRSLQH